MVIAESDVFIHPTAEISPTCTIGSGTRLWHQVQVLGVVEIGRDCTIGKGAFIGDNTQIGDRVKIGNYANLFGAQVESEAFIGPMVCLIEDAAPRATNTDGTRKGPGDFARAPVTIRRGASIGAGAIVMPGVTIGAFAMVSAGAVVHKDVPNFVIAVGNPARFVGHACRCGKHLSETLVCSCGLRYRRVADNVVEQSP